MSKREILANIVRATSVSLNTCPTEGDPCNCDQAKALDIRIFHLSTELQAASREAQEHAEARARLVDELAELRAAAHLVLAWIDRSNSVGREAAQRLERALAVGGEAEAVAADISHPIEDL